MALRGLYVGNFRWSSNAAKETAGGTRDGQQPKDQGQMLSTVKRESPTSARKHERLENSNSKGGASSTRYPVLRERVAARLNELGMGPVAAAEKGGLHRNFITDFLLERKKSVNSFERLEHLARALGVSPAYLTGTRAAQNPIQVAPGGALLLHGTIAEGIKHRRPPGGRLPHVAVQPDPRFPGAQAVFAVADAELVSIGAPSGSWLLAVAPEAYLRALGGYRPGQLVICSLTDTEGEELVVRRVITFPDRVELHPVTGDGTSYTLGRHPRGRRLAIKGVVLKAIQELA